MYQFSDEILSFYRQTQESKRLVTDAKGQLEFVRTQEIITRYLPDPPAVVLDIGGGSGPYACWLAKAGTVVQQGKVGIANCQLMPQRTIVDFAVHWLEKNKGK